VTSRRLVGPRLVVAVLAFGAVATGPTARDASAGPREARGRWKEAQALDKAPWRERLLGFRAVRRETTDTDSYFQKALAAEAHALDDGEHAGAVAATLAAAAWLGARRDPDRYGHALAAARALLADEDRRGARPHLDDVLECGGPTAPAFTAPALELLGRLAFDDADAAAIARLERRADDETPGRVDVRLALRDLRGVLLLDRGDRPAAERVLAEQRRIYDAARREGDDQERVASRAWLKLDLPKRLDVR
jgi:hypothetical protein